MAPRWYARQSGALLVLALLLAGCGPGGGATATTAPAPTAPASGARNTAGPTPSPVASRAANSPTVAAATPQATPTRQAATATRPASPRPSATAAATGAWLDAQPLTNWNTRGAVVPKAPAPTLTLTIGGTPRASGTPSTSGTPRAGCIPPAFAATTPAERAVAAAGWTVFVQEKRQGNVALVSGLASYDGMCRPMQYQLFVFVSDTFAGTLSPVTMNSRADGAIEIPMIAPDGAQITARYLRYAPTDPACCASRTSTLTFAVEAAPPLVVPQSVATHPNATPATTAPASPTR